MRHRFVLGGVERLTGVTEALQAEFRQRRRQTVGNELEAVLDLPVRTSAIDVV